MTELGVHPVTKRVVKQYQGNIYAFNGDSNYFVTPNHPFMTTEGWKSLDPEATSKENKDLKVTKLHIGDTLIMKDGKTKVLKSFESKYTETTVYNFNIEGGHTYYADDYLVHNKDQ